MARAFTWAPQVQALANKVIAGLTAKLGEPLERGIDLSASSVVL